MWTLIGIIVGAIVGLAINVGLVYYFVSSTSDDEKSPAVAAILSLVLGPLIGYAYARPEAWGSGLAVELFFATPVGLGAAALGASGNIAVAALVALYSVVAIVVTAVLMAQDQNERVQLQAADAE